MSISAKLRKCIHSIKNGAIICPKGNLTAPSA